MASNKANLDKVLTSASRKAVTRKTTRVLPKAKSLSGAEGASLGYTVRGNSHKDIVGRVASNDPKFIFIEKGTRPHFIYPRNGKSMVFPGLGGNRQHAKVVFHPGTRGKHALKKALRGTTVISFSG